MFLRISVGFLALAGLIFGQEPAFDAVSVRRVKKEMLWGVADGVPRDTPFQGFHYTPGRVTCRLELRSILAEAYGLASFRIEGPGVLTEAYYDVVATMPEGTKRAEARLMLRRMLVERFGLRAHEEMKETDVLALVVGPKGAKLKPPERPEEPARVTASADFLEVDNGRIQELVTFLVRKTGRPVVDRTGLEGRYHFRLETLRRDEEEGISVQTALGQQLGLKLEKARAPWRRLVVDHVEAMPTEN